MKRNAWKSTIAVLACTAALLTVGSAPEAAAGQQVNREHTWCC